MVRGIVKWFNNLKGFGFIQQENGEDVYVHYKAIHGKGYKTLKEGDAVVFEIDKGPKGLQAEDVWPESEYAKQDLPTRQSELVALALLGDKVRIVSLTPDGKYRYLDELSSFHNILYVATSETLAIKSAVEELEEMLNNPRSKESDFQDFFERNPDFIVNDEYKKAHSHIVLTREAGDSLVPDFVLEPIDQSSLCDLLELKLPSVEIFVLKKNRIRFSAAVMEVCAQLREYSNYFDEEKNRNAVFNEYGLSAYRPKMFVVIGRRSNISPIEVRKAEADLPILSLRTYDDILARMKNRVDEMKTGRYKGSRDGE